MHWSPYTLHTEAPLLQVAPLQNAKPYIFRFGHAIHHSEAGKNTRQHIPFKLAETFRRAHGISNKRTMKKKCLISKTFFKYWSRAMRERKSMCTKIDLKRKKAKVFHTKFSLQMKTNRTQNEQKKKRKPFFLSFSRRAINEQIGKVLFYPNGLTISGKRQRPKTISCASALHSCSKTSFRLFGIAHTRIRFGLFVLWYDFCFIRKEEKNNLIQKPTNCMSGE